MIKLLLALLILCMLGCSQNKMIEDTIEIYGEPDIVYESSGDLSRYQSYDEFLSPEYAWESQESLIFFYFNRKLEVSVLDGNEDHLSQGKISQIQKITESSKKSLDR